MISKELLQELKEIIKEDTGVVLTDEQAEYVGYCYIKFFGILLSDLNYNHDNEQQNSSSVNK